MSDSKNFLVVGAGMGGLATALRLSHLGHRVVVLEKTGLLGGRNRPVAVNDSHFDGGPTLLMMLAPFRKLFTDVGEKLEDHLEVTRMDPGYRVFYRDRVRLESSPDQSKMKRSIEQKFGASEADGFDRLMRDLGAMYAEAIPRFVEKNFHTLQSFLNPGSVASVFRHRMMGNLYEGVSRYVKDPKLRMLFSFQTMYLGLSPYEAPWVYAVLTYMEFGEGIYYPRGGLVKLAEVIADRARRRGAEIRLNADVKAIDRNSVTLANGEVITADAVVVNADLPYAYEALTRERLRPKRHSCSACVLYLDYAGDLPDLLHHNVFFGREFKKNLDEIFVHLRLPDDPSFYVAISSRTDGQKAAEGHLNLMILIPCPNLDFAWSPESEENLRDKVFARLSEEVGFEPSQVTGSKSYGPLEYRNELNLSKGAAFGLSHHFGQSAFFRPGNRSKRNPHLYFVGASTVPGNGLPMVLISAQLVEERIRADFSLG